MANTDDRAQAENAAPEPLIAQLAFKGTPSDKDDVRFISFWNEQSESEVLRRFFDFDGLRAEAARCRAARDEKSKAIA